MARKNKNKRTRTVSERADYREGGSVIGVIRKVLQEGGRLSYGGTGKGANGNTSKGAKGQQANYSQTSEPNGPSDPTPPTTPAPTPSPQDIERRERIARTGAEAENIAAGLGVKGEAIIDPAIDAGFEIDPVTGERVRIREQQETAMRVPEVDERVVATTAPTPAPVETVTTVTDDAGETIIDKADLPANFTNIEAGTYTAVTKNLDADVQEATRNFSDQAKINLT